MWAETIKAFRDDETGATAIEYGLIAALIAAVLIGGFTILGDSLVGLMNSGTGSAADVIATQAGKIN